MPKIPRILAMLEKFQGDALCAMYSVGCKSSRAALRGLTSVSTYEVRWMELLVVGLVVGLGLGLGLG